MTIIGSVVLRALLGFVHTYVCPRQIKNQFYSGALASRSQFAGENELDRDFSPVLSNQMVSLFLLLFACGFPFQLDWRFVNEILW
jgi:hypothetical protein